MTVHQSLERYRSEKISKESRKGRNESKKFKEYRKKFHAKETLTDKECTQPNGYRKRDTHTHKHMDEHKRIHTTQ
jgi:hypothetical protein